MVGIAAGMWLQPDFLFGWAPAAPAVPSAGSADSGLALESGPWRQRQRQRRMGGMVNEGPMWITLPSLGI